MIFIKLIFKYIILFIGMFIILNFLIYFSDLVPYNIYNEIECEAFGNISNCRSGYISEGLVIGIFIFIFLKFIPYKYNIYIIYIFYSMYIFLFYPEFKIDKIIIQTVFFSIAVFFSIRKC